MKRQTAKTLFEIVKTIIYILCVLPFFLFKLIKLLCELIEIPSNYLYRKAFILECAVGRWLFKRVEPKQILANMEEEIEKDK